MIQKCMSDTRQIDPDPLTDEEIADIEEFRAHPEDHMTMTLEEFFKKVHSE